MKTAWAAAAAGLAWGKAAAHPGGTVTHANRHPPVGDFATDFDHTDAGVGRRPVPDLGRPAAAVPGRAHRPVRRGVAAGHPRPGVGGRLRPRALHLPLGRGQRAAAGSRRPARAHRAVPADHLGPALSRHRPADAAARLHAQADRRPRAVHPGSVPGTAGGDRGPAELRRRRRLRPAHPGPGHRQVPRLPPGGRGHVPQHHPPGPGGGRPSRRGAGGAVHRSRRLHGRPDRGPHRPPPGRPHLVPHRGGDRRP